MVFDTLAHGQAYRKAAIRLKNHCPSIICLQERHTIDSAGFVKVGGSTERQSQPVAQMGQLPITETAAFQRLQRLHSMLGELLQQLQASDTNEQESSLRQRLTSLEDQLTEKVAKLKDIDQQMAHSSERPNQVEPPRKRRKE
jgi:hypothetical protein